MFQSITRRIFLRGSALAMTATASMAVAAPSTLQIAPETAKSLADYDHALSELLDCVAAKEAPLCAPGRSTDLQRSEREQRFLPVLDALRDNHARTIRNLADASFVTCDEVVAITQRLSAYNSACLGEHGSTVRCHEANHALNKLHAKALSFALEQIGV